jgi:HEAT repeat protein
MLNALVLMTLLVQDDKAVEEALAAFKAAYKGTAAQRAGAVSDLARTPHEKTLVKIGALLGQEENPVRIAAAKGLSGFTDYKKKATVVLLGALAANEKNTDVQVAILEAIGALRDEEALPTLHRYFENKDVKVAKAALLAAAEMKKAATVDVIIDLMKRYEKYAKDDGAKNSGKNTGGVSLPGGGGNTDPRKELAKGVLPTIMKALQVITTEKWASSTEWVLWWEKHKSTFTASGSQ